MATYGLTDPLDRPLGSLLDGFVQRVLDLVDRHASVVVDDTGVEVRGLVLRRRARWSHVERVEVKARLDVLLAEALTALPVARFATRLPILGGLLQPVVDDAVRRLTDGPLALVRRRLGDVVTTIERPGPDVHLRNQLALLAAVRPALTRELLGEAARRGIPVVDVRRDEPQDVLVADRAGPPVR